MNNQNNNQYLSIQDILSLSLQECKERFVPLFLLASLGLFINWLVSGICFGFNPLTQSSVQQANPVLLVFVSLISAFVGMWTTSALVLFICKRVDTVKQALIEAVGRIPRLFAGSLLFLLALMLGVGILAAILFLLSLVAGGSEAVALVLGAIMVLLILGFMSVATIYLVFLPYKLILTDDPILQCFPNAFALVKGHFWWTVGFMLILALIIGLISGFGMLALMVLVFLLTVAFPAAIFLVSLLWVPLGGVMALIFQVPTIALYLDRSTNGQNIAANQENTPSLEQGSEQ